MKFLRKELVILIASAAFLLIQASCQGNQINSPQSGTDTRKRTESPVTCNILIRAPLHRVWTSIHEARSTDPELTAYSVLIADQNREIVQQTMILPFLGEARCILSLTDSPPNKIEYELIESNLFKTFDGTWFLSPASHGQATRLNLTCYSDLKYSVPKFILKSITAAKMRKRLDFVKALAEKKNDSKDHTLIVRSE